MDKSDKGAQFYKSQSIESLLPQTIFGLELEPHEWQVLIDVKFHRKPFGSKRDHFCKYKYIYLFTYNHSLAYSIFDVKPTINFITTVSAFFLSFSKQKATSILEKKDEHTAERVSDLKTVPNPFIVKM